MNSGQQLGVRLGVEVQGVNRWIRLVEKPNSLDEPNSLEASDDNRTVFMVDGNMVDGNGEDIDARIDAGLPATSGWRQPRSLTCPLEADDTWDQEEEDFYFASGGYAIGDEGEERLPLDEDEDEDFFYDEDEDDYLFRAIMWGDALQEGVSANPGLAARLARTRKKPTKREEVFPGKVHHRVVVRRARRFRTCQEDEVLLAETA